MMNLFLMKFILCTIYVVFNLYKVDLQNYLIKFIFLTQKASPRTSYVVYPRRFLITFGVVNSMLSLKTMPGLVMLSFWLGLSGLEHLYDNVTFV